MKTKMLNTRARLFEMLSQTGFNANKLSDMITSVSDGNTIVNRHRCAKLLAGDVDHKLSMRELACIDAVLRNERVIGLSSTPLLERDENLIGEFSDADRVSFIMGVRYFQEMKTEAVSRWDLDSRHAISRTISAVRRDSHYILRRGTRKTYPQTEWLNDMSSVLGDCRVVVGSPQACAGAEFFLADFFDVKPFDPADGLVSPLQFHFRLDDPLKSTFVTHAPRSRKIVVAGNTYHCDWVGSEYGVVVGQRLDANISRFVVAGVSGPGTYAAAKCLAEGAIQVALPPYTGSESEPVLIAVSRGEVSTDGGRGTREHREVVDQAIVTNILLKRIGGKWHQTYNSGVITPRALVGLDEASAIEPGFPIDFLSRV